MLSRPPGFIDPCLPTLARAVPDGPLWVHEIKHDGYRFIAHACQMGLEGIVAKRRDRPYRSGRCLDWIKVKNSRAPAASRHLEHWK